MLLHCQPNVKLTRPDNLKLFHPRIQIVLAIDCFSLNILKTTCRWGGGWMYGPPGHNLTATMSCENCLLIDDVLLSFLYSFRTPFITIPNCGPTRRNSIVWEGRHCLIITRQNYPPTGAHHSLRFASQ